MESYKLHIKVGPHEFQGEGPEDAVKKSFDDWKSMIASLGPPQTAWAPLSQVSNPEDRDTTVDDPQLSRLFLSDDKRGLVTLRILPRGEDRDADAALLILFGFRRLRDQDEVLVTQLKAALNKSGCSVDRVDAVAAKYLREGLLNKGGSGKGGRYSLTNSGAQKAISLIRGLLS